jgi:hypothetical protein
MKLNKSKEARQITTVLASAKPTTIRPRSHLALVCRNSFTSKNKSIPAAAATTEVFEVLLTSNNPRTIEKNKPSRPARVIP